MKVRTLIELLEECDPEADVYIMGQQNYPFENTIHGITVREEFSDCDDDDDEDDNEPAAPPRDRWTASDVQLPRNDVFIVEGQQTRYGSKDAWDAARRE